MTTLRKALRSLLHIGDTPERTAFAFALGVLIGFSPFLGLHTLMGLVAAFMLKLNRIAVLLGVYMNNPWLLAPYYALATWVGVILTGGGPNVVIPQAGLRELLEADFWFWIFSQWKLLIPAAVGSSVLCLFFSAVAYPVALYVLRRSHSRRRRATERAMIEN